jgi:hypothetical protein
MRTTLAVLGEYVGHLAVGAAMFAALLFFGVALHLLADWAETLLADRAFLQLMRFVEEGHTLFGRRIARVVDRLRDVRGNRELAR